MTVIEITGDGFLYNMVRIIAGTLVLAGIGRMDAEGVRRAVESRDRQNAGPTAPPQGLYLAEVYYEQHGKGSGVSVLP
jgi:tRNA pseudouridine38-40 synthase